MALVNHMTGEGYCLKHNPLILMLDGHASRYCTYHTNYTIHHTIAKLPYHQHTIRWTHRGLKWLNDHYIYPFCIASKTSAWAQSNDCGINANFKAEYGRAKKDWRITHPLSLFDREAYNKCLFKCIIKMQTDQAAELSAWNAKVTP